MSEIQNQMLQLGVYALVVRGEGKDLLMGRDVKDFIKVNGLEDLLHSFISDLDHYFTHIYQDDVKGFLAAVQEKLKIDLLNIQSNLQSNITEMKKVDSDEVMIQYLIITKTLEMLRQQIYDAEFPSLFSQYYVKQNHAKPTPKLMNKIKNLDLQGSQEFSLLYNLIFIHYIAPLYGKMNVTGGTLKLMHDIFAKIILLVSS